MSRLFQVVRYNRYMQEGVLSDRFFPRKTELFNLFFPLFLLCLSVVELLTSYVPSASSRFTVKFFEKMVFLNFSHIILSILIIFYLPEGRAFLKRSNRFESKLLLVAAITLTAFFSLFVFLPEIQFISRGALLLIYMFLLNFWATWHSVFQVRGIALMYERLPIPSGNVTTSSTPKIHLQIERALYTSLVLVRSTSFYFIIPRILNIPTPWMPEYQIIGYCSATLGILICGGIIYIHSKKGVNQTNKLVFLLRLFHTALAPVSFVSASSMQAIHGMESLFFTQHAISKSAISKDASKNSLFLWGSLLLITFLGMPIYLASIWGDRLSIEFGNFTGSSHGWINGLIVFAFTMTVLHFYLDTRLYKVRNPAVRETTGKLLRVS